MDTNSFRGEFIDTPAKLYALCAGTRRLADQYLLRQSERRRRDRGAWSCLYVLMFLSPISVSLADVSAKLTEHE